MAIQSRAFNAIVPKFSFIALVIALAALDASLLAPHYSFAQETDGLKLSPAFHEERVDPGSIYTHAVTVTNLSNVDRTYYLLTEDIEKLDENNQPVFSDNVPTSYQLSKWVVLPSESIELKAGETKSVPFTIRVPQSASPGSHFGGIFFDLEPQRLRTVGTGVGIRVGTILSLRISGEVTEELVLREFSTDKFVYSEPTVIFDTKIENLGNVLMRPAGFLEITDMFGAKVANIPLNESAAGIFPQSERIFKTTWETDRLMFGRYQAVVSVGYGLEGSQKTIFNTVSFWVLPLKPVLIVLGVLFGAFILLYVSVRYYIRKKINEMSGGRRADAELYSRRYQKSSSPMTIVVLAGFVVVAAFLVLLFFMLA
jgi:hypothetical protein